MNILMLRGQIPQDRDPQEIVFNQLDECDDMWTHLVAAMTYSKDTTELWYWGGKREKKFRDNFTERWVPSFSTYKSGFDPDIIFCRGGFPEYHYVLRRFPYAMKIYYGAGRRFLPQPGFDAYNIILQDSPQQLEISRQKFPKSYSTLFIKPAADNIFKPVHGIKKEYDVCFPANAAQTFKGHDFVYSTVPKDIKLLNLGNRSDRFNHPSNVISYKVLRSEMAENISKCTVGIVATKSSTDSCPRVIPEMLACDIPVITLDRVPFWQDKYIVSGVTGEVATTNNFWQKVRYVLDNRDKYTPRDYYEQHLNLKQAAKFIRETVYDVRVRV